MGMDWSLREGYAWAEDKEHCEEYGRMLNADPSKVASPRQAPRAGVFVCRGCRCEPRRKQAQLTGRSPARCRCRNGRRNAGCRSSARSAPETTTARSRLSTRFSTSLPRPRWGLRRRARWEDTARLLARGRLLGVRQHLHRDEGGGASFRAWNLPMRSCQRSTLLLRPCMCARARVPGRAASLTVHPCGASAGCRHDPFRQPWARAPGCDRLTGCNGARDEA